MSEATPAGGKVGICIYKFDDNFMTTYRNALQEILEGKGYEVTVVDGNNDQAKQTEQINTFITQGVDALIINPVMTSAAAQIVSTVKDAGIPTVLINRCLLYTSTIMRHSFSNFQFFRLCGRCCFYFTKYGSAP